MQVAAEERKAITGENRGVLSSLDRFKDGRGEGRVVSTASEPGQADRNADEAQIGLVLP